MKEKTVLLHNLEILKKDGHPFSGDDTAVPPTLTVKCRNGSFNFLSKCRSASLVALHPCLLRVFTDIFDVICPSFSWSSDDSVTSFYFLCSYRKFVLFHSHKISKTFYLLSHTVYSVLIYLFYFWDHVVFVSFESSKVFANDL